MGYLFVHDKFCGFCRSIASQSKGESTLFAISYVALSLFKHNKFCEIHKIGNSEWCESTLKDVSTFWNRTFQFEIYDLCSYEVLASNFLGTLVKSKEHSILAK